MMSSSTQDLTYPSSSTAIDFQYLSTNNCSSILHAGTASRAESARPPERPASAPSGRSRELTAGASREASVHALVTRGGWIAFGELEHLPYVSPSAAEHLFGQQVIPLRQRTGRRSL